MNEGIDWLEKVMSVVQEGIVMGRRKDLIGGGLIRSQGGWAAVKELRQAKTYQKGDERILGDGDFVEEVLRKSEEKLDMSVQDVPVEFSKKLGIKTGMGVIVVELVPGGSSDEAGIRKGDVILEVNRRPIGDVDDFLDTIKQVKKGDALLFLIKREGGSLFLAMMK